MKMSKFEFDKLFSRIDNGFVGSEQHVYNYQNKYAQYFKGKSNVLDIGCGQGAFLRSLKENGINATGLDMDEGRVNNLNQNGYNVLVKDAFTYLDDNKETFDGISMFHMIEHFDGYKAVELLVLIFESLQKNGVVILITPNFHQTFANQFWLSTSHVRPYPLLWLENALKEIGFNIKESGYDPQCEDTFIVGVKK